MEALDYATEGSDPRFVRISKPRGCQSLIVKDHGWALELSLVVVPVRFQRRGIGTEAVRRVQQEAVKRGVPVWLNRVGGTGWFYRRLGFTTTKGRRMEWASEVEA